MTFVYATKGLPDRVARLDASDVELSREVLTAKELSPRALRAAREHDGMSPDDEQTKVWTDDDQLSRLSRRLKKLYFVQLLGLPESNDLPKYGHLTSTMTAFFLSHRI